MPKEPKPSTIKRLFAVSRNECAFPSCHLPIVESDGIVTGIICHIKARSPGGPRYDSRQKMDQRHSFENLLLLCARHSKIIDSQPKKYPVSLLQEMKGDHELGRPLEISESDSKKATLILDMYRDIYIGPESQVNVENAKNVNATNVHFDGKRKTPKFTPPAGSIAASLSHRNYTKHLIDRYLEFGADQKGRKFSYPVFYENIKKLFGAKWDLIPVEQFEDLVDHVQSKIDGTRLGRINKSKGISNYSTFEAYLSKYQKKKKPRKQPTK